MFSNPGGSGKIQASPKQTQTTELIYSGFASPQQAQNDLQRAQGQLQALPHTNFAICS